MLNSITFNLFIISNNFRMFLRNYFTVHPIFTSLIRSKFKRVQREHTRATKWEFLSNNIILRTISPLVSRKSCRSVAPRVPWCNDRCAKMPQSLLNDTKIILWGKWVQHAWSPATPLVHTFDYVESWELHICTNIIEMHHREWELG